MNNPNDPFSSDIIPPDHHIEFKQPEPTGGELCRPNELQIEEAKYKGLIESSAELSSENDSPNDVKEGDGTVSSDEKIPEIQTLSFTEAVEEMGNWLEQLFVEMKLPNVEIQVEADEKERKVNVNLTSCAKNSNYLHALMANARQTGRVIESIQHILREMLRRLTGYYVNVSFDIEYYLKNRTEYFENVAQELATAAKKLKRSITVAGFTSFDRRVVHHVLAEADDITTNSVGQGAFRKLCIEPK